MYIDEWKDMTNYLYNENDSAVLCKQLAKLAILERGDALFVNSSGIRMITSIYIYYSII